MNEAGKSSPGPAPSGAAAGAGPAAAGLMQISIEDFQKIALRVGSVVAAENHPNADRLLVLTVDIGEGPPRRVVAGIRGTYQASELLGKQVVVVANLKPATLRGIESQGMVLAASDSTGIFLVSPGRPVQPGSTVK